MINIIQWNLNNFIKKQEELKLIIQNMTLILYASKKQISKTTSLPTSKTMKASVKIEEHPIEPEEE